MELYTSKPSSLAILLFIFATAIELTSAHYCEWNTCESWETCCGNNVCCGNSDITFYITFVCVSAALLFLCCTLFYVCQFSWRFGHPMIRALFGNYKNLSRDVESSRTNLATEEVLNDEMTYPDLPPPYSEVVQNRN